MDKNIIKSYLKSFVSEAVSPTPATTPAIKLAKKIGKENEKENKAGLKAIVKDMSGYEKGLTNTDPNEKEMAPNMYNYDGNTEVDYHDQMEIMNGQEMVQYDREPGSRFKERAMKAIEGDSTMGNNPEWANVYPKQQGFSGPDFGKNLVKKIKASEKKRNQQTPTSKMFGDDWEVVEDKSHKSYAFESVEDKTKCPVCDKSKSDCKCSDEEKGKHAMKGLDADYEKDSRGMKYGMNPELDEKTNKNKTQIKESMKRLRFKKEFNGVGNALKLIPESYKVNEKVFEMTDGNENYRIRWEGSINEGSAIILMASDGKLVNEDMEKMKKLMGYKSQDTLGNLKGKERINENNEFTNVWNKTKKMMNEIEGMEDNEDDEDDKMVKTRKDMYDKTLDIPDIEDTEKNISIADLEKQPEPVKFVGADIDDEEDTLEIPQIETDAMYKLMKNSKGEHAIIMIKGDNKQFVTIVPEKYIDIAKKDARAALEMMKDESETSDDELMETLNEMLSELKKNKN